MINILIRGVGGRLGRAIAESTMSNPNTTVSGGVDIAGFMSQSFPVFTDLASCDVPFDVIIDCSIASAVPELLEFGLKTKKPLVICTTGFSDEMLAKINAASAEIPILKSANMSIGINVIAGLLKKAAVLLADSGFDIEIVEKHHNKKLDAPSGTALLLADAINDSASGRFDYVYDRSQKREERSRDEIGISAVRGGGIIGEHTVIFAGSEEVIEINHTAMSKTIFAAGAVKAAEFIITAAPGLYDMSNVLSIEQ